MELRLRKVLFGTIAVLSAGIAVTALPYVIGADGLVNGFVRANYLTREILFGLHAGGAAAALVLGIWQFRPASRRTRYHRIAGRLYALAVLIGASSGFVIAQTVTAGPVAALGFSVLALLWLGATAIGVVYARRREFVTHRRWMYRSYGLASAAITLRLITVGGALAGVPELDAYRFAAWASWIVSLGIAELLARRATAPIPALR